MLQDSLNMMTVNQLPPAPSEEKDGVLIVFLAQQDGDFTAGMYYGRNGEWKAVGSTGGGGAVIRTLVINTDETPSIDVAETVGESLILSALVRRPGETAKSLVLYDKNQDQALETVSLIKEYTPISVPQPYDTYRLDADPGLEVTLKVL